MSEISSLYEKYKVMNREQKRKLAKQFKISYRELVDAMEFSIMDMDLSDITEGTKVKLRYDKIIEQKKHLSDKYLKWVEENKDKSFTFQRYNTYDEDRRGTLVEDESEPKWIFHVSDLLLDLQEDRKDEEESLAQ